MPLAEQLRHRIEEILAPCDEPREALLQVLEVIQADCGCVDAEAVGYVANRLKIHRTDVDDVMSFYTVFTREKLGRFVIRVCRTLPCALAGGEALIELIGRRLGIAEGQTTGDGRFTLLAVECLGLCEQAPAMLVNDEAFGHLTPDRVEEILSQYEGR